DVGEADTVKTLLAEQPGRHVEDALTGFGRLLPADSHPTSSTYPIDSLVSLWVGAFGGYWELACCRSLRARKSRMIGRDLGSLAFQRDDGPNAAAVCFRSQCGSHRAETVAFGSAMCRWSPALLNTIRAGASPASRGIETAADCPAANTVSNRATAALSVRPCWVVTATWKPSGSVM